MLLVRNEYCREHLRVSLQPELLLSCPRWHPAMNLQNGKASQLLWEGNSIVPHCFRMQYFAILPAWSLVAQW